MLNPPNFEASSTSAQPSCFIEIVLVPAKRRDRPSAVPTSTMFEASVTMKDGSLERSTSVALKRPTNRATRKAIEMATAEGKP